MHGVIEKRSSTEQSMNLPAYVPRAVVLKIVCTLESPGKHVFKIPMPKPHPRLIKSEYLVGRI